MSLLPGHHVLHIGYSWGGLAMAMTECHENLFVTGITLSERQLAYTRKSAAEHSLEERLDVTLRDYRDQSGAFDRIVWVGMLENVGPPAVPAYFKTLAPLLAADGVAVIHSVAVRDRGAPANRCMTRYIFPGRSLSFTAPACPRC